MTTLVALCFSCLREVPDADRCARCGARLDAAVRMPAHEPVADLYTEKCIACGVSRRHNHTGLCNQCANIYRKYNWTAQKLKREPLTPEQWVERVYRKAGA